MCFATEVCEGLERALCCDTLVMTNLFILKQQMEDRMMDLCMPFCTSSFSSCVQFHFITRGHKCLDFFTCVQYIAVTSGENLMSIVWLEIRNNQWKLLTRWVLFLPGCYLNMNPYPSNTFSTASSLLCLSPHCFSCFNSFSVSGCFSFAFQWTCSDSLSVVALSFLLLEW